MKLNKDKLFALSHGAVRAVEDQGKVRFYRFTEEQQNLYKTHRIPSYYLKTCAPAGIRLEFRTDSKSLFLKVNIPFATTRSYFSIDVCVNGELLGSINNYSGMDMTGDYTQKAYPLGSFEKGFALGDGEKTISIFMPWSVPAEIEELSIDDGAFAEPVFRNKKILAFGDSITQGCDALIPSKHYIVKLSDLLQADVYNKAVGGECFFPQLAECTQTDLFPDYIFVAYGTNDWNRVALDTFRSNCKAFYSILSAKYPGAKIFALTPVWRKDHETPRNCGAFAGIADYIEEVAAELDNVTCVNGWELVPHDEKMYGDLRLHPNDHGFAHMANNLYKAIKNLTGDFHAANG